MRNIPDAPDDGWFWYDLDVSLLSWLQAWYIANCDGDWEHGFGVKIETIDNPGWSVSIDLERTPLHGLEFGKVDVTRDGDNWVVAQVEDNVWRFVGGPLNLSEGLYLFREWVRTIAQPGRDWSR